MIIANGEVYTENLRFERKHLRIEDGRYSKISSAPLVPSKGERVVDASGMRVLPGLTDIHFHGCMGADLCDGTPEAIRIIARYERSVGVTNICPATMTLPADRLLQICAAAASCKGKRSGEAELVGIHLEGPFISPAKVGAQNPAYVVKPDAKLLLELMTASGGLARLVTVAPEAEGAAACIRALSGQIHFSLGHTAATYEQAAEAFAAGADHVTHLFNAMPPLSHRAPGPIAAAAEREDVYVELICDGVHLHPAAVRTAFRLFGAERVVLISDSMRACGMPDGDYELGGLAVVKRGREARQTDGTLAGSASDLYACMVEAIRMGVPAEDAVRAAAVNPPRSIGLDHRFGLIKEGREAQALLVDEAWRLAAVV